ncbi:MAG TPA: phosphoglycerate mutase family protein [Arenimonas sp.]|nr:phosphoglycerate mutase family protein [Arenimonas sp.]
MKPYLTSFILLFIFGCQNSFAQQTVFLIRHAEKVISTNKNPALSEIGTQRANALVQVFNNAKPAAIFTTQYQRTQLTAKPLSTAIEVPITILEANAENTEQYPALLMQKICVLPAGSNVLVVGHSNTLPAIMEDWTKQPAKPIADEEYNRIFMVMIQDCKAVESLDLRY